MAEIIKKPNTSEIQEKYMIGTIKEYNRAQQSEEFGALLFNAITPMIDGQLYGLVLDSIDHLKRLIETTGFFKAPDRDGT